VFILDVYLVVNKYDCEFAKLDLRIIDFLLCNLSYAITIVKFLSENLDLMLLCTSHSLDQFQPYLNHILCFSLYLYTSHYCNKKKK